jgi:hypothetical protein
MNFDLTEDTFFMYAIKHYDNPACKGLSEFNEDMKKFKYLKRLLGRYHAGKGLKDRLIMNHIIVINNLFGPEASVKMLFYKVDKKHWPALKTFLVFLNLMPENVVLYNDINESDVPVDMEIANVLRRI